MPSSMLQWGLGFLPEEIVAAEGRCSVCGCASMGPRVFTRGNPLFQKGVVFFKAVLQWGLGFLPEEMALATLGGELVAGGFNGASGFYPRKSAASVPVANVTVRASMGPRVFTRGNPHWPPELARCLALLQWGLGFLPEEIRQKVKLDAFASHASMGPRVFTRGNCNRQ